MAVFGVGLLFVDAIQPAGYRWAGRVVEALGGSDAVAVGAVLAIWTAAAATGWAWGRRIDHDGLSGPTIGLAIALLPLWLWAFALTPPSRDADEALRMVEGFVGDPDLASALDRGVSVALAVVVGLVVLGLAAQAIERRRRR